MVKVIVGMTGSSVAKGASSHSTSSSVSEFLSIVKAHNVHELDTARGYVKWAIRSITWLRLGRETIRHIHKSTSFLTRASSFQKRLHRIVRASLKALATDKVDIYYLHGPDRTTPLEDQCRTIAQLHKEGKFKRFGVSNISD